MSDTGPLNDSLETQKLDESTQMAPGAEAVGPARGPAPGRLQRGEVLGRYVILAQVGAGAMGVVYQAYDPELDRIVAVKVVRDEGRAGRSARSTGQQRLLREAQALAKLSHPNVVAVHDVGALEGGIFLAMEYVAGQTLDAWLREAPRTQREVLEIFCSAGAGLAAAHQQGVVHRDFKPQNVLIDQAGRAKVVDFGLARRAPEEDEVRAELAPVPAGEAALDLELTAPGQLLGTPRYMAPEQARGEPVSVATDQFAFCVALYVALYGHSPFVEDLSMPLTVMLALKEWRVREAPKGSRVPPHLRRALVRGLSVEPLARFSSMNELLAELARDPARTRRHWLAGGGVALLATLGVAGLSARATSRGALCSGAERHLTGVWDGPRRDAVRAAITSAPQPFAQETWARLEPLLDDYAGRWAASHVEACEATRLRGEQSEQALDLRMACLQRRRSDFKALTDLFASDPAGSVERAVQATDALGDLRVCDDVQTLSRPPPPPAGDDAVSAQLSDVKALIDAGIYAEGLRRATEALGAARAQGYRPSEARALFYVGWLRENRGDKAGASTALMESMGAAVAGREPIWVAHAAATLADMARTQRQFDAGHGWVRIAEAAARDSGKSVDRNLLSHLARNEASLLGDERKYDESRAHYQRALDLLEGAAGVSGLRAASITFNLSVFDARAGRHDEGMRRGLEALRYYEQALGPAHPMTGRALHVVGDCEMELKRYDDASATLTRALALHEAAYGGGHVKTATVLQSLARLRMYQGHDTEALALFERAAATYEAGLPTNHPFWLSTHCYVGLMHLRAGRLQVALRELEKAEAVREAVGVDDDKRASVDLAYARALDATGSHEKARRVARKLRSEVALGIIKDAEAWLIEQRFATPQQLASLR